MASPGEQPSHGDTPSFIHGSSLAVLYFVAMTRSEQHDTTKSTAEELKFKAFRCISKLSSLLQPAVLNWNEEAQAFEN